MDSRFNGTYTGFGPTSASSCGMGEARLVITGDTITLHLATALEAMQIMDLPRSTMVELSAAEIACLETIVPDPPAEKVFRLGETGVIIFWLGESPRPDDVPKLWIVAAPDSIFGEFFLFTAEQVQAGIFDAALRRTEEEFGPGCLPRLADYADTPANPA